MPNIRDTGSNKMVEGEDGVWHEACRYGDCSEVAAIVLRAPGMPVMGYCELHARQRMSDLESGIAQPQVPNELAGFVQLFAKRQKGAGST